MQPIEFEGQTGPIFGPKGSDIMPLPCYRDGMTTTSCWQFTPEEIKIFIENGGKMWVTVYAGESSPPISIYPQKPNFPHADGMSWIAYRPMIKLNENELLQILNVFDKPAPGTMVVNQRQWVRMTDIKPARFKANERFKSGDYYIRKATQVEQRLHNSDVVLCRVNTIDTADVSPKDERVEPLTLN